MVVFLDEYDSSRLEFCVINWLLSYKYLSRPMLASLNHGLSISNIPDVHAGDFPTFAVVDVNSTSLEGSYTIHPFVQNNQLVLH